MHGDTMMCALIEPILTPVILRCYWSININSYILLHRTLKTHLSELKEFWKLYLQLIALFSENNWVDDPDGE